MSQFSYHKIGEDNIIVRIKRGNGCKALAIVNTEEQVFSKLPGWPKVSLFFSRKTAVVALSCL